LSTSFEVKNKTEIINKKNRFITQNGRHFENQSRLFLFRLHVYEQNNFLFERVLFN